jgi:hypothetical protein
VTFEQIDKRAEELFRECGGLPIEWGAVDECTRMYYRKMAARDVRNEPVTESKRDAAVSLLP